MNNDCVMSYHVIFTNLAIQTLDHHRKANSFQLKYLCLAVYMLRCLFIFFCLSNTFFFYQVLSNISKYLKLSSLKLLHILQMGNGMCLCLCDKDLNFKSRNIDSGSLLDVDIELFSSNYNGIKILCLKKLQKREQTITNMLVCFFLLLLVFLKRFLPSLWCDTN